MQATHTKHSTAARVAAAFAVTAFTLGLSACDKAPNAPTVGQRLDSAIQKTEQAGAQARVKTDQALQRAETKMDAGAVNANAALQDASASASALARDAAITAKVSSEFAKDPDLSAIRIDVDTQAGAVRLTGPAPTQTAKDRATALAQGVEGVLSVRNELIVSKG